MGFGWQELLIILVIVGLIFGTSKLRNMGSDLGGAVKGFKKGLKIQLDFSLKQPLQGIGIPFKKDREPFPSWDAYLSLPGMPAGASVCPGCSTACRREPSPLAERSGGASQNPSGVPPAGLL